nr:flagellar basal body-associated FliL family protein [Hyphomicrobium methylovorum]
MVKQDETIPAPAAEGGSVIKGMIAAIVLGAGSGVAFGYFAVPDAAPAKEIHTPIEESKDKAQPVTGRFPNDAQEIAIPSILVDLKGEPKTRVRLDVSIVAVHGTSGSGPLKGEVREDVIGYLKGLNVSDIQGVRGFQNLREQLDDRAKIRGRGAILGLLIGGLVIE